MDKNKILILGLFAIFFAASVSAQGVGLGDPLAGISESLDTTLEWYPPGGDGGAVTFLIWIVLPFIGFYAIFNFIYRKAFGLAEENLKRNTDGALRTGSDDISDLAKSSGKLLAISSSIISVVYLGDAFGWLLLLSAPAAILWLAWSKGSILLGSTAPLPNNMSTPWGSDSDNVSERTNQEVEALKQELNKVKDQRDMLKEELNRIDEEQQSDNENISSGEESADEASDHIKKELEQLDEVEKEFNQLEKEIEEIEEQIRQEEGETSKEEENIQKILKEVKNYQEEMFNYFNEIESVENEIIEDEKDVDKLLNRINGPKQFSLEQFDEKLDKDLKLATDLNKLLESIDKLYSNEFQDLQKALEIEEDVNLRIETQEKAIKKLEEEIDGLIKESQILESLVESEHDVIKKAEQLAKKVKDREDYKELEKEEKLDENLEDKLRSILNKERSLKEKTKDLEELDKEDRDKNRKLISELESLRDSLMKLEKELDRIEEPLADVRMQIEEEEERVERAVRDYFGRKHKDGRPKDMEKTLNLYSSYKEAIVNSVDLLHEGYGDYNIKDKLDEMISEINTVLNDVEGKN